MRASFEKRRDAMVAGLGSFPGYAPPAPRGRFYAFADCRGLYGSSWHGKRVANDEDLALWLLDGAHVAAVAGERVRCARG